MKQFILFTTILLFLYSCAVKKEQRKQQVTTQSELQTDCISYRSNKNLQHLEKLKIKQILFSVPDSIQQQFIQSVTYIESDSEHIQSSTTHVEETGKREESLHKMESVTSKRNSVPLFPGIILFGFIALFFICKK